MRGLVAAVALAVPGLAQAQIIDTDAQVGFPPGVVPFGQMDWAMPLPKSTTAMYLPLSISGAGFDTTGATSAVSWDGSALVDSAGLTWGMTGTVPQVAATALPTTASSGAAGPFSAANYYAYGTASDPLDSTGDRFGCAAFSPASLGAAQMLWSNGNPGTSGHYVQMGSSGVVVFASSVPASQTATTGNTAVATGLNVACWWRTGNSIFAKLNLGTTATTAAGAAEVSGTAYVAKIGLLEGGGQPFTGTILHVIQGLGACPTPPAPFAATCEGWATYQMKRYAGLLGARGEEITLVRTTTATNEVNGTVWNVPASMPRVTTSGTLVERASTNYVLNNRTHPKAAEATSAITATVACVGWHEGTGTMTIANGTATTTGLSCTAVSPGTLCTFNVTVTGTMAITTSAGTVTKAQIECPGSTKTSEIPTLGTAVTRNADVLTVPTPSVLDPARWCVETTATPYASGVWIPTANRAVAWIGAASAANAVGFNLSSTSGVPFVRVYDNAAALKSLSGPSAPTGTSRRLSWANSAGTLTLKLDGGVIASGGSGAGTGVPAALDTTTRLGWDGSGAVATVFDGYLSNFRIYRSPLCR